MRTTASVTPACASAAVPLAAPPPTASRVVAGVFGAVTFLAVAFFAGAFLVVDFFVAVFWVVDLRGAGGMGTPQTGTSVRTPRYVGEQVGLILRADHQV